MDIEDTRIAAMLREGRSIGEVIRALGVPEWRVALLASELQLGDSHLSVSRPTPDPTPISTTSTSTTPILPIKIQHERNSESDTSSILVGMAEDGHGVFWNPKTAQNPHLMIVGESGSGKTYSVVGLLCEMVRRHLSPVVIDYSRSYSVDTFPRMTRESGKVAEVDIARHSIALNPLEIKHDDVKGPTSVAIRVAATFKRIYGELGVHQERLIRESIEELFRMKGIVAEDRTTWTKAPPHLSQLYTRLQSIADDEDELGKRRSSAESTYSHISSFFAFDTFNPDGLHFDWGTVVGSNTITILQLNGLDGTVQKAVTEFLLWDAYYYMSSRGQNPLSCLLILDEAHNLSFKVGAPVDKIVREARKFGLGAVLASQQLDDFKGSSVLTNTNTKIFFKAGETQSKMVKRIASTCRRGTDEIQAILSTLNRGNAFVIAGNMGYKCRVPSHEERGL